MHEPGGNLSTDTRMQRRRVEKALKATSCGRREGRRNQTVCRQSRGGGGGELVLLPALFVFMIARKKVNKTKI